MKAKDYAKRYLEQGETNEALMQVCFDMLKEFETIANTRNAKSDEAALAIICEIEQRWKAFSRLTNTNPGGFRYMVKKLMPETAAEFEKIGW